MADELQRLPRRGGQRTGVGAGLVMLLLLLASGVAWKLGAFDEDNTHRIAGDAVASPTAQPETVPSEPPAGSGSPVATGIKAPAPTKLRRTDEFGYVTAVRPDVAGLQVSVDRVDMLSGEEAAAASRAAGGDGDVPNDYFLRNDNPLIRSYRVAPDAVVWGSIRMGLREPWPKQTTLARWRQFVTGAGAAHTLFHFEIHEGVVTGIEEQYLP